MCVTHFLYEIYVRPIPGFSEMCVTHFLYEIYIRSIPGFFEMCVRVWGGGVPGEECRDLGVREGWGWRKEGGLVEGGGLGVGASQILNYHKIKRKHKK